MRSLPLLACAVVVASCSSPPPPPPRIMSAPMPTLEPSAAIAVGAQEAKRLEGLGVHHRAVSTRSREAQDFFDQGLRLYWAFNHEEAFRSFAKAAEEDPRCAMCFWGAALSLGPNYNMPMMPDRARAAWDALERAARAAPASPAVEQSLVTALTVRYAGARAMDPKEVAEHDRAYAEAMRSVAHAYPQDVDVLALYAESLMILDPWKLWAKDGTPAKNTPHIVSTLERALMLDAAHPGANHLYIHAVEASKTPERAERSADLLMGLMPDAGHIVHMPAHIYQRIGRYEDAARSNRLGIAADDRYGRAIAPREMPMVYGMYRGHNFQFLAVSATTLGRSAEAFASARRGAEIADASAHHMPPAELYAALPHVTLARFSRWDDVVAEPMPHEHYRTATVLAHYARGLAFASTNRLAEATTELDALRSVAQSIPADHVVMNNKGVDVAAIAALVLDAKLVEQRGDRAEAVVRLREAVQREDGLAYHEPPDWWYSTRQDLGATLLRAKRAHDAEEVYRAELAMNPRHPWALFGLAKALSAQGKKGEAEKALADAKMGWNEADVPPPMTSALAPRGHMANSMRR